MLVLTTPLAAAPPRLSPELARLDGFALGLAAGDAFSGVVLVAAGDRIVFERGYGKRDARGDAPVTPDTRFNLASAGKMFTAVAILQLVAAGKVALDTRIDAVIPDFPNPVLGAATVRQLLTHQSGAGEISLFGAENEANRAWLISPAAIIGYDGRRPAVHAPGARQEYSNLGFVVLGRMVELLSGEDYESYVAHHIFAPAGMTRTGFVDCTVDASDLAVGYATVDDERVRNCATQPRRGMPAGGTVATARDLFAFTRALRTGRLLPPALFAEATRVQKEFMGLGFFATDYGNGRPARDFRWGHGGAADGANADVRVYPRTGETVIVLANRAAPVAHELANFLHDQAAGRRPRMGR